MVGRLYILMEINRTPYTDLQKYSYLEKCIKEYIYTFYIYKYISLLTAEEKVK